MILARILLVLLLPVCVHAQYVGEEAAIKNVIDNVFDAMRAADSSALRPLIHPSIRMLSIDVDETGKDRLHLGSLEGWLSGVANAEKGAYDEQVWSYSINTDDNMATVWTPYTFFLNGNPHHCGVNAFQLFRNQGEWQIIQVTDTRRTNGCPTGPEDIEQELNDLIDNWHEAAAKADAEAFFGAMTEDGVYIGTDASERWLRDEMREWAKDAFERDSAWDFTSLDRTVQIAPDGTTAWWDETLDTWMGVCWASGILRLTNDGWKIRHFQLAIAVPNEKVPAYLELMEKE